MSIRLLIAIALLAAESRAAETAASQSAADLLPVPLDSGMAEADVEKRPYLEYVAECAGLLMEHGTDRYGRVHSPILMTILDVRTRNCPENPRPFEEQYRVIRRDRRGTAGANLYLDQPTVRTFYLLSGITGDPRYAGFANKWLGYYLSNLVDDKGLIWWGWHRHYDAWRDEMTGHLGNPHEIHFQQAAWPLLWQVNSQAVTREIEAVWQWHVIDKNTGEVNRHADGQRGCDFAFSAGEILHAFVFLYTKTNDRKWLDRARLVSDYYWNQRDPRTNLIPTRPNAGKDRFDGSHFDTSVVGLHGHSLLKAFELAGEPLFRDRAVAYLKAYAALGHDARTGNFWGSLNLDGMPVPGPRTPDGYAAYEPRGLVDLWQPYAAGYEQPLYAAQAYAYAYDLTRDEAFLAAARKWAACIQRAWSPRSCEERTWYAAYARNWAPLGTYAGNYGQTISFFLHLHALSGEPGHLQFARAVAREAVSRLYYRGIFRGHPGKPYYEAVDGVGYLLYALLQLDRALALNAPLPKSKGIPLAKGSNDLVPYENW